MITWEVDTTVLSQKLLALSRASGIDAREIVKTEVRQLSRQITNFTPPIRSETSAQKTGEHAVEAGIKAVFSEAQPQLIDEVGSRYGISDIQQAWISEKDGTRI